MSDHEASRTLVKSPPELWAECSDAGSLARHLGEFGEIKITRLEPETTVAWEGERASGTVRIEPSAWGTKVTLTAQMEGAEVAASASPAAPVTDPVAEAPPAPESPAEAENAVADEAGAGDEGTRSASDVDSGPPALEPAPAPSPTAPRGLLARLRMRLRPAGASGANVGSVPPPPMGTRPPEPPPEPEAAPASGQLDAGAVLTAALDSLGQAHHRPYSRA